MNSIENQQLYQILVKVDKLTLQIALMKIQGYSTCENSSLSQHYGESCLQANGQGSKEKIKKSFLR